MRVAALLLLLVAAGCAGPGDAPDPFGREADDDLPLIAEGIADELRTMPEMRKAIVFAGRENFTGAGWDVVLPRLRAELNRAARGYVSFVARPGGAGSSRPTAARFAFYGESRPATGPKSKGFRENRFHILDLETARVVYSHTAYVEE